MRAPEWSGDNREPTGDELAFASQLNDRLAGLDYWLHEDDSGEPWMLISMDVVDDQAIVAVPRADFDGTGVIAGYSPAYLNWDSGVRAAEAGITVDSGAWAFSPGTDLTA
jgi:hypothetical protein